MASGLSDVLRDLADEPAKRPPPRPSPPRSPSPPPAAGLSKAEPSRRASSSAAPSASSRAALQPVVDRENGTYDLQQGTPRPPRVRSESPAPRSGGSRPSPRAGRSRSASPGMAAGGRASARRNAAGVGLKKASVPILVTVGSLMMVPALWGLAVLMGIEVPRSQQAGAGRMATAMLACWPIALGLYGGAAVFWMQLKKQSGR